MYTVDALDGYFLARPEIQEFLDSCTSVVGRQHIRFDEPHQPYADLLYTVRFRREDEYIVFVTDFVDPWRLALDAKVKEMSDQIAKEIDADIVKALQYLVTEGISEP